jgi:alcohol dehydrogenase class IV
MMHRFGRGVTKEIGHDLLALGLLSKKVLIVTDRKMANLPPMIEVLESLKKVGYVHKVE